MWYFVVFQPSKCRKTHFQPQIWSIWPIFPNDSESLPKVCYIKRKNSEILSKCRNSESAEGSVLKGVFCRREICCPTSYWTLSIHLVHQGERGPRIENCQTFGSSMDLANFCFIIGSLEWDFRKFIYILNALSLFQRKYIRWICENETPSQRRYVTQCGWINTNHIRSRLGPLCGNQTW